MMFGEKSKYQVDYGQNGHAFHYTNTELHHMRSRFTQRGQKYAIIGLTAGIMVGFLLCFWMKTSLLLPCAPYSKCCLKEQLREEIKHEMLESQSSSKQAFPAIKRKQVLIGVMTAARFVDNRARAVWETWAKSINGDIFFFSSEGTPMRSDLPVVAMPGVDDAYPPQKKSFMMVKYLHDYGIDKYDFFMRVDDDVYIHGQRLSQFLSMLNNTKPLFIGQAGTGNAEELGKLFLEPDENFCMGGPGIVFSAETLRRMVPHIGYCLQNLLSTHEDVELGRCVRMFAGVPCTFNYEMQKLFHHSYYYKTDKTIFPYVLTGLEMDKAVTLHPVKSPEKMYEIHNTMMSKQIRQQELLKIQQHEDLSTFLQENNQRSDSVVDYHPKNSEEIIPWIYFNKKSKFAHNSFSVQRNEESSWKSLMISAVNHILTGLNADAQEKGRLLEFKEIIYGFRRIDPLKGVEFIVDVLLEYKRIKGKYAKMNVKKRVHLLMPYGSTQLREITRSADKDVHLILPLSGKYEAFTRFLNNFEQVCNSGPHCRLVVILYEGADSVRTKILIQESSLHQQITIMTGRGGFSRAQALHQGVVSLPEDSLMLFIDVDVHFTRQALNRVRQHSVKGQQLYFPIVYSQFDSHMVCNADICPVDDKTDNAGYYRYFGFGIASMYKSDYLQCGGFDLTIHGWGKEDVDLFSKVLKQNSLTVFRAADQEFVHIYHPVVCDTKLNDEQTVMCVNSKAASYASKEKLAEIYFKSQSKVTYS